MNLHVRMLSGRNPHHIVEATFKALARALDVATQRDPRVARRAVDEGDARGMSAAARHRRLRRRQPAQRAEGARAPRRSRREITSDAERIAGAPAVVLPGQGAFGTCMREPREPRGWSSRCARRRCPAGRSSASASACRSCSRRARSRPACAGSASSAAASCASRATASARCRTWAGTSSGSRAACRALAELADGDYVYFVHSYHPRAGRPRRRRDDHRLRRRVRLRVGPRQRLRRAVPPREEPARRAALLAGFVAHVAVAHDRLSRRSTCAAGAACGSRRATSRARPSTATTRSTMARRWEATARAGCTSSTSTARAPAAPVQARLGARDLRRGADPRAGRRRAARRARPWRGARRGRGARVLGTAAVRDPALCARALRAHSRAASLVGIDARDGQRARSPAGRRSRRSAPRAGARRGRRAAPPRIVYTDIARDGTEQGPDVDGTRAVARAAGDPGDRVGRRRRARRRARASRAPAGDGSPASSSAARSTPARRRSRRARRRAGRLMLARRIIPCLDVKDGRVVKGVHFVDLRDAGDPVEIAARYDAEGADELCFLDITASHEERPIILDVVARTAERCFMPLTVGGGVRDDRRHRALLNAGADKVSINTAAVARPEFVARRGASASARSASSSRSTRAGASPTTRRAAGRSTPTAAGGRPGSTRSSGRRAWRRLGAGEILLTSMDRDGTQGRATTSSSRARSSTAVGIPVIASGGVGTLEHMLDGLADGRRDAALAASIFHYGTHTVRRGEGVSRRARRLRAAAARAPLTGGWLGDTAGDVRPRLPARGRADGRATGRSRCSRSAIRCCSRCCGACSRPLGLVGGMIWTAAAAACFSSWLHFMEQVVRGGGRAALSRISRRASAPTWATC